MSLFVRQYRYVFVCAGAIIIAVILRTIFTVPVEVGGDAIKKWLFLKSFVAGAPLHEIVIDHHTARWGVNIPSSFFVVLFGTSWFVYYLIPIVFFGFFLAISIYIFRCAYPDDEKSALFAYFFFLFLFYGDPSYLRSTSQLMPFIFVAVYISLHIIFLWRSVKDPSQANIFLATLFMFLAYGAKETSLFYAPGSGVFVLWALGWRRGLPVVALMALYGLLLVGVETLAFSLIFGQLTTRLDMLFNHFGNLDKVLDQTFGKVRFATLFVGWVTLPLYTTILFVAALASALFLVVKSRRGQRAAIEIVPGLLFISYGLIHTFALKSIDPLIPFIPPKSKYFADLVPWAAMSIAFAARDIVGRVAADRRPALAKGLIALSLLACVVSLSIPRQWRNIYPAWNAWMWHSDQTYAFVSRAVKIGLPIKTLPSAERLLEKLIEVELEPKGGGVFVAAKHSLTQEGGMEQCIRIDDRLEFVRCGPKK